MDDRRPERGRRLVVMAGAAIGDAIELPAAVSLVGREADADIRLPFDAVSRRHVLLDATGDEVSGPRFAALAARLARAYDVVVHLAPPVDGNGYGGGAVAALVDDVVVVVGPAAEPAAVDRVVATLGDAPLLAFVD